MQRFIIGTLVFLALGSPANAGWVDDLLAGATSKKVEKPVKKKIPVKHKYTSKFAKPKKAVPAPVRSVAKPVISKSKKVVAETKAGPKSIIPGKVAKPVRTKRIKPTRKLASKTRANWWENVGNPAVFAFRDCASGHARTATLAGANETAAVSITNAMKTTCSTQFSTMAGVLVGGLGEKQSRVVLKELAETTFIPPVKQAIASATDERNNRLARQRQQAQMQMAKAAVSKNIEQAKAEMFKCFVAKTDRLSVARSTRAETIADSVIIGCQNTADAFFDLLLANSKASPAVKLREKNVALNDIYRQAIIKRVLVTRGKAKIQTAKAPR